MSNFDKFVESSKEVISLYLQGKQHTDADAFYKAMVKLNKTIFDTSWRVYILECSDGTLYTGITNDLENRLKAHNNGTGAKYTKGRGPVKLLKTLICSSKSEASKIERKIKKLSREDKLKYV